MTKTQLTTPTPTSIHIERHFAAPLALVWRAHTEPDLVKQWMTGPADHSLPVCEIDLRVGGRARYVWKNRDFEMGMTATFEEIVPQERIVHTESYDGWPEGDCTVTTTFTEEEGETIIRVTIEYASRDARDTAMQPGFEEGYAASHQTLDGLLRTLQADR